MVNRYLQTLIFFLVFFAIESHGEECSAIFPGGVQNNDSSGTIDFKYNAQLINNPTNELFTNHLTTEDPWVVLSSCDTTSCEAINDIATTVDFNDFGNGTTDIDHTGPLPMTLEPGYYGEIKLGFKAKLVLTPGDYYLTDDLVMANESELTFSESGSGTIRIFIEGSLSLKYRSRINVTEPATDSFANRQAATGDATRLFIYIQDDIITQEQVSISAFLYSENNVNLKDKGMINGAVTAKNIELINDSRLYFINDDPDFGDICRKPLIIEYCDATFVSGASSFTAGGTIEYEKTPTIFDNPNNQLMSVAITSKGKDPILTCDGFGDCRASGLTTDPIGPFDFIDSTISKDEKITITNGETILGDDSTDNFGKIEVKDDGILTFSGNQKDYFIAELDAGKSGSAVINLVPGDYYIGKLTTKNNTTINIIGEGDVRLFIKDDGKFEDDTKVNITGTSENLLVYGFGNIKIQNQTIVHGFVYAQGDAELKDTAQLTGAISAAKVKLKDTSKIYYSCPVKPLEPVVPILNYRFDECLYDGTSGEVIDQLANFNGDTNNIPNPINDAIINKSLDLSALNPATPDWIKVPKEAVDGLNDFSISVWIKTPVTKDQQEIFQALGDNASDDELELFIEGSDEVYIKVLDESHKLSSDVSLTDNNWHHIVVTRQGEDVCLFVDGAEADCDDAVVADGTLAVSNDNAVVIGQEQDDYGGVFDSTQSFEGQLDEFKIYDSKLAASDVAFIYQSESNGKNYDGTARDPVQCNSLIAYYQFDELAWSGTSKDVLNELGTLPGTAIAGASTANINPARIGNPGTCGYGDFNGINQYVEIDDDPALDLTDKLTVTTWIYPTKLPGSGLMTILSKDENYEFHVTPAGEINWWWDTDEFFTDGANIQINNWYHIAITFIKGKQVIYINGENKGENTYSGTLITNSDPLQIGQDQDVAGRYFQGSIDEIKIYDSALSAAEVYAVYEETHPCDSFIDHFEIDTLDGQGITCAADVINIKACADASCTTVNSAGGVVKLYINDTYYKDVLVAGENGTTTSYRYTTVGNAALSLDQTYECVNGDPTLCDVTFVDAAFRFVTDSDDLTLPLQLSGKPSNIGFNADTLKVEAVKTDATGACAPLLVTGQAIEMAASYQSPTTGTKKVNISGVDIGTAANSTGFDSLPFTEVALDFGNATQNSAEYIFSYPDAGAIILNARYELPDDDGNPSGDFIEGTSNPIIVRPFAFDMFVDKNLPTGDSTYKVNPAATDSNGDVFTAAGAEIRVSIRAVAWKSGNDANANGLADQNEDLTNAIDNPTTENFTNVTLTSLTHTLVEPVAGTLGVLAVVDSGDFSAGIKVDTATYDEVGIISLATSQENYLAAGVNIAGVAPFVGRFIPNHFTITAAYNGVLSATCSSSLDLSEPLDGLPFVYSGQMLSDDYNIGALTYSLNLNPTLIVEARNTNDVLTKNYIDDFYKLSLASFTRLTLSLPIGTNTLAPNSDATQLGSDTVNFVKLLANINEATLFNSAGESTYSYANSDNFVYLHEENSEINEFTSNIDLSMVSIIDEDDVTAEDHDSDSSNGLILTLHPVGKLIRFGRVQLENSYGPETSSLPQPLSVNYYKNDQYTLADDDFCSPYNSTNMSVTDIDLSSIPVVSTVDGKFIDEEPKGQTRKLELAAPGAGNTGQVCVSYDILPWLQYNWATDPTNLQCAFTSADVDGLFNDNPFSVATFGIYRGNDRIIYQREISR